MGRPFPGICTSSSLQSGRAGDPRQYRSVVILVSTRAISLPNVLRFAQQAQYRFTPQNPRQTALPEQVQCDTVVVCNIFTCSSATTAALAVVREMLKTQLGKQPSIAATVEYALHQTALKVDSNYQKTPLVVAS